MINVANIFFASYQLKMLGLIIMAWETYDKLQSYEELIQSFAIEMF